MIKCFGFGKLLKQFFIISLISCFGLLGNSFVNAGTVQSVGLQDSPSIYNNQYDITFLKGGAFKSMFLGQAKSILALNSNLLFFRTNEGKLYYFNNGEQGYFGEYWSCDEITGLNYDIGNANCSSLPIDGDYKSVFKNFFQNVKAGDYVYYNVEGGVHNTFRDRKVNICFSNSVLHKSICFLYAYCSSSQGLCNGGYGDLTLWNYGTLTGSLNLTGDTTFANISQSLLGYAPGQAGYNGGGNIDGESQEVSQSQLTGDVMYASCSKGMAFDWYRANGYKTRMCYAGYLNNSDIYNGSGNSYIYGILTGLTYDDVYIDTANLYRYGNTGSIMSDVSWLDYWRKTFETYNKSYNENLGYSNPFVGVPVSLFTLMGNIYSYGLPYSSASIIEFCDLSLYTSDYSVPYTGIASSTVCSMSALDFLDIQIANGQNPDDGRPGYGNSDGTVGNIGSSWDGITNRPGYNQVPGSSGNNNSGAVMSGLSSYQYGLSFQNNFFNLAKDNFVFPNSSGNGILPSYIIIFMCALVFFRFLSH